ncbi:GldM family protein [Flavisolibacter tropicus]|uniref:Gliding motility-associated protein GldM C-terminal domain-containing protein n=1 Tax=Flavisolibacter tropicus TaxID=1492898 RepID=A0A172TXX5_9BACT|nr:GldM family protein [Flavisolibacter tropicus]ANE51961.1 hypothetical protein SY85_17145 [Flavisolibacter tropicus]
MLKALLPNLLLLLPFPGIGQIMLRSLNVNHPDSNIVFIGIDNYLELKTTDTKKDLRLYAPKASVFKLSNTKYVIHVSTIGNTLFEVYDYSKSPRELLLSKTFTSRVIPDPEARIGYTKDSTLTIAEILANPQLHVVYPNSGYTNSSVIMRFKLTIIYTDLASRAFNITDGNQLTDQQMNAIKELSSGDKLVFEDLAVTCPGCRSYKLWPYSITIK